MELGLYNYVVNIVIQIFGVRNEIKEEKVYVGNNELDEIGSCIWSGCCVDWL